MGCVDGSDDEEGEPEGITLLLGAALGILEGASEGNRLGCSDGAFEGYVVGSEGIVLG